MMDSHVTARCHRSALWAHVVELRLHDETVSELGGDAAHVQIYATMPSLEREVNRRIFWVAYMADRTAAAIDGMSTLVSEDGCGGTSLPAIM